MVDPVSFPIYSKLYSINLSCVKWTVCNNAGLFWMNPTVLLSYQIYPKITHIYPQTVLNNS